MDTCGSLIDKISTINQKLFLAQQDLYIIRTQSFEEFKENFGTSDEKLKILYDYFHKATNLNLQRQANILEFDKLLMEIIKIAIKGENLDNGSFIQNQFKTY